MNNHFTIVLYRVELEPLSIFTITLILFLRLNKFPTIFPWLRVLG